jgi:hypothetical protein
MLQIGLYWGYLVPALAAFLFIPLGRSKPQPAPSSAVSDSNFVSQG